MVNFSLSGVKRMSFADYMNNTNILDDQIPKDTSDMFTLNNLRASSALTQNPDVNVQQPVETPVANEPAPTTLPSAIATVSGKTGKKPSFFETLGKPVSEKYLNVPVDQFATLAGSLAHAISPTTPQGRMGAAIANFAGPIAQKRMEQEIEAPEKALAKRLVEAKIADLEKIDSPKTAMEWYLKNNPKADPEQVAAFQSAIEEGKGSIIKITGDDGAVSFYKGGTLVGKTDPGVGQTKSETLYKTPEGYLPASEAKGKMPYEKEEKPSPVTWTTATKSLGVRFGKQDSLGNIIVTPELQHSHQIAQKKLVELKNAGVEPLDAVNKAEEYARHVEDRFWLYISDAQENKELSRKDRENKLESIRKNFKSRFGYIPRTKR